MYSFITDENSNPSDPTGSTSRSSRRNNFKTFVIGTLSLLSLAKSLINRFIERVAAYWVVRARESANDSFKKQQIALTFLLELESHLAQVCESHFLTLDYLLEDSHFIKVTFEFGLDYQRTMTWCFRRFHSDRSQHSVTLRSV